MNELKIVPDASAVGNIILRQNQYEKYFDLLSRASETLVPDLFFAEMANVLWKDFHLGNLSMFKASPIGQQLIKDYPNVVSNAELLGDSILLSMKHDCAAYDMFYLALALRSNYFLVTADKKLRKIAEQEHANILAIDD